MDNNTGVLIIDTREKFVTRHVDELSKIKYEIKQITTGDYCVIVDGKILVTIERKSLEDYGASIKDGRHTNKQKLLELRAQTGCRVIYIIEGPEFPDPNKCFANIPYRYIESSIFHLQVRDGISIIRTRDSLCTAQTLVRFMQSMNTLNKACDGDILPILDATTINTAMTTITTIPDLSILTARHEKSDQDVVRELWSCFKGISVESASEYMRAWSVAEIVRKQIDYDKITHLKMANGKLISKKAVTGLTTITKLTEIKLLSTIPGISHAAAVVLLETKTLGMLLSYGKEMSIEITKHAVDSKPARRLGDKLAEKVVRYFNYKHLLAIREDSIG